MKQTAGFDAGRPTELVNLLNSITALEKRVLSSERWKFGSNKSALISPVLSKKGLRYDPAIMSPSVSKLNRSAAIIERVIQDASEVKFSWRQGVILIIDNHQMLHARGAGILANEGRVIERVLISTS